jgi:hypothetical protein
MLVRVKHHFILVCASTSKNLTLRHRDAQTVYADLTVTKGRDVQSEPGKPLESLLISH